MALAEGSAVARGEHASMRSGTSSRACGLRSTPMNAVFGGLEDRRLGFIPGSHNLVIASLIQQLKSDFTLKDLGSLHYFLGIQVKRDFHGLHRRQSKYILDVLHRAHMVGAKPYSAPCTSSSKLAASSGDPLPHAIEYRQIVEALQYCTLTRLNIAYSANQLCQHLRAPTTTHWTAAKLFF
ncbi:hypothetical protein F2P56_035653, partial [Juglans regia]